MKMPEPTSGHAQLERLAGTWTGEETMHASVWMPHSATATGTNLNRIDLYGFALIGEYRQERDGKETFRGHSVFTYDAKQEKVVLHWFDCMGSPPEVFTGRFEGDELRMGHGGPGPHARLLYDLGEPEKMVSWMEMSDDGEDWQRVFDAVYHRE